MIHVLRCELLAVAKIKQPVIRCGATCELIDGSVGHNNLQFVRARVQELLMSIWKGGCHTGPANFPFT